MRVTHSAWRMSSPGSRMSLRRPARSYRSKISAVSSLDALSVAITKSTPAWRWNAICASTTSASFRARSVMTSLTCVLPEHARHRVDHALGRAAVDDADDLLDGPAPLLGELVRLLERALDAGDDLLEALGAIERAGGRELLVVLADDVLRRPRLPGRCALVVEHADGRTVAHERVEQDRPRVADDDVRVLEQRRELLDVRVARLLHARCPRARLRPRSAPASGCRAGGAGREAAGARARCDPTTRRDARRTAPRRARCSACCPPTTTRGRAGVEPVAAQQRVVLGARPDAVEQVGLRPAGDANPLRRDAVVAAQVVLHHAVLDDVEVAVRRDDALADGVVPARDVRHDRQPQPPRSGEERHRVHGLHVREQEARAVAPSSPRATAGEHGVEG